MEERLVELETRFSFQEDTIETLGKVLTDQQAQIDALTRHIDSITRLLEKLLADDSSESDQ